MFKVSYYTKLYINYIKYINYITFLLLHVKKILKFASRCSIAACSDMVIHSLPNIYSFAKTAKAVTKTSYFFSYIHFMQ